MVKYEEEKKGRPAKLLYHHSNWAAKREKKKRGRSLLSRGAGATYLYVLKFFMKEIGGALFSWGEGGGGRKGGEAKLLPMLGTDLQYPHCVPREKEGEKEEKESFPSLQ